MSKEKTIPKISFSTCLKHYKRIKFKNLATRKSRNTEDEELPRIEFEDINSGTGTLKGNIYEKNNKHKRGIHFEQQDILFGKLRPYLKNWYFSSFEGVAIGDFWVFKAKEGIDSLFLYTLIQSEEYQYISNVSIGTKMPRSDWDLVKNYKFTVPDIEAQQKIGSLFEKIDQAILLQQQVLETTKTYKQSMLQKMFPKKHEKVPQIRFNNFVNNWKSITISEVVKNGSKKRVEDTSQYRRLTVKLNKNGLEEYVPERKLADTRPFYQRYTDEIIIGKQNYFNGSIAIVPEEFNGFICSNAIMSFSVPDADINFIYNFISQDDFIRLRSHLANGTGQKELSEKDFLNFNIKIPTLEEQQKIGSFFKTLDEKIEQEEKKLEAYQSMKKALMQRMFV